MWLVTIIMFRNSLGQEFSIKVFLSGDYEFLCHMYGLSGASGESSTLLLTYFKNYRNGSGRHCCLWCLIKSDLMKIPRGVRGRSPLRTLASITTDHNRYCTAGSNLKKAKEYNNVIGTTFLDIEIDQVIIW